MSGCLSRFNPVDLESEHCKHTICKDNISHLPVKGEFLAKQSWLQTFTITVSSSEVFTNISNQKRVLTFEECRDRNFWDLLWLQDDKTMTHRDWKIWMMLRPWLTETKEIRGCQDQDFLRLKFGGCWYQDRQRLIDKFNTVTVSLNTYWSILGRSMLTKSDF